MVDHNINIKSKSEEAKAAKPSSVGTANLKKLEKIDTIIEKALDSSMKKLGKEFQKAFKDFGTSTNATLKKSTSTDKVYSPNALSKALVNAQQSLLKDIKKSISESAKGGAGQKDIKLDTTKLEKTISTKLDSLNRAIKSSTGTDIKIDTSGLKTELIAALKKSESKELVTVVKTLSSEIHNLKGTIKNFNTSLGSLKDTRKEGINVKEIVKAINSLKDVVKQSQKVQSSTSVITKTVKESKALSTKDDALSKEITTLKDELKKLSANILKSAKTQVAGVAKEQLVQPAMKKLGIDDGSKLVKNIKEAETVVSKIAKSLDIDFSGFTSQIKKVQETLKEKIKVKVAFVPDTSKVETAEKEVSGDVVKPVKFDIETKSLLELHKELSMLKSSQTKIGIDTDEINKALELINDIHKSFVMGKSSIGAWSKGMQSGKVKDDLRAILKDLDAVIDKSSKLQFREVGREKQITRHIEKSAPIGTVKEKLTAVSKTRFFKDKTTNGDSNKARQHFRQVFVQLNELQKQLSGIEELSLGKLSSAVDKASDDISKSTGEFSSEVKRAASTFKDVSTKLKGFKGAEQIGAVRSATKTGMFPRQTIRPDMPSLDPGMFEAGKRVSVDVANLAKSLEKAQTELFNTLKKGLKQAKQPGWDVAGKTSQDAFKLRGRQWGADIVNVKKLSGLTGIKGTSEKLLKEYKKVLSKELFSGANELKKGFMASEIAKWIKQTGLSDISSEVKDALGKSLGGVTEIKRGSFNKEVSEIQKDVENALSDSLQDIFAATAGSSQIQNVLKERGLVKTVSLPAAKLTATGDITTETRYGSKRAAQQTQIYKTGQESLFEKYQDMLTKSGKASAPGVGKLATGVRAIGPYAKAGEVVYSDKEGTRTAGQISATLLKGVGGSVEGIAKLYKESAPSIAIGRQRLTAGTSKPMKAAEELPNIVAKIDAAAQQAGTSLDAFIDIMRNTGVTAFDVAKSKDVVKFENIYDDILKTAKTHIAKIADMPATAEKSFRDYDKVISQIEGLSPIIEPGRPRRGAHQADIVKARFQTSAAFTDPRFSEEAAKQSSSFDIDMDAQKTFIKDVNKRMRDLYYEIEQLGKLQGQFPDTSARLKDLQVGQIKKISSLGLPESTAGTIKRAGTGDDTVKQLEALKGVELTLYAGDLRKISPFGSEFQQTGRNISNVSAAKEFSSEVVSGIKGIMSEFPTLRSQSEQETIKSGRFGGGGYGFNVTAELRNTAGTFEDQILVSGKLAEAVTTSTKKLVQPFDPSGEKATGMKEGQVLKDTTQMIDTVNKEIMQKLGVSEDYKGRADVALIKDVQREMSSMRGESVEVQTAKLAEVFLSNFGRKFTTRFGSKGVAVSPGGASQNFVDVFSKYGDKQIKVLTEEQRKTSGLGVAMMPKSMGELMAEMVEGKGLDAGNLSEDLRASGNKFILSMFKDVNLGLVTEKEANKNQAIYTQAAEAATDLGFVLTDGIDGIRNAYKKQFGDAKSLVEAKPIDIRVSSYGAAKRGLQTESLETITSNIAGISPGAGGSTVLKDIPDYKKALGVGGKAGMFAKSSQALGFKGAGKSKEEIKQDLGKMYELDKVIAEGDKEAIKKLQEFIERAATLEDVSKYYVDVIDEFGKQRKSLVGTKFVQIVEDPGQTEEWTKGAIASGSKGAKLNIPAYAAYTTIFGKESSFMKELNSSFDMQQAEGFEQIKAYLAGQSEKQGQKFLTSLKSVSLGDIQTFTGQVGTEEEFKGTVLDLDKYKTAFKTTLPSTKGKEAPRTDLYVPGSIARQTFEDPTEAGKRGMDVVTRNLQNVVNAGRSLEAWYDKNTSLMSELDKATVVRKAGPTLHSAFKDRPFEQLVESSKDFISEKAGTLDPDIFKTLNSWNKEAASKLSQGFSQQYGDITEASQEDFVSYLSNLSGYAGVKKNLLKSTLVGDVGKLVSQTSLGAQPDVEKQFSMIEKITSSVGESIFDPKELERKQQQLNTALNTYYTSLADTITGKTGAVAKTFFTRKIPAVLGKATNATVDRTEELGVFSTALRDINTSYGDILGDKSLLNYAQDIDSIKSDHAKSVSGYKETGLPVLKQHELGVPETLAKTLSLEFEKKYEVDKGGEIQKLEAPTKIKGTLASLLKYVESLEQAKTQDRDQIKNYIESELLPYIESIRFPFTGVSSVQPFKAKLLKDQAGKAEKTLMVPGVPEMDMPGFKKVSGGVEGVVKGLSGRRDRLREEGTMETDIAADRLTVVIDKLNAALSEATPKYISHAQKLDFDGDQIEIHTARTGKSREEIKRHFDILTKDVDSTAAVFRKSFTSEAIQPTQPDEYPLAYSMKAFEKKFPTEKGFEFLHKPFATETLEHLPTEQKLGILATKEAETGKMSDVKAINKVMSDVFIGTGQKFKKVSGDGDMKSLSDAVMKQLAVLGENTKAIVEGNLKTELLNAKLDDAVEAQLFKIHTGPETESITRIMRAYESKMGFGGGEISLAQEATPGKIDKSFMLRQRHTQMNELMRFAIQKGMDVKHAGEKTVAGEMVKQLTSGEKAVDSLVKNIEGGDSYKELREFMNANTMALKNEFGRYTTTQLQQLSDVEGIDVSQVGPSREEIINSLVKQMGFEGFLRDMQKNLHEQAVAGVMKLEGVGKEEAGEFIEKKGIDVSKHITSVQDPLYKLRTPAAAGLIDRTPGKPADLSEFTKSLETSLSSIGKTGGKGAYSELTRGFVDNINNIKQSIDTDLVGKFKDTVSGITFADPSKFSKLDEQSKQLEKYESALGMAPLSKTVKDSALIQKDFLGSVEEGLVKDVALAGMSSQEIDATEDSYRKFREQQELLTQRVKRLSDVYGSFTDQTKKATSVSSKEAKAYVSEYSRTKQTYTDKPKTIGAAKAIPPTGRPTVPPSDVPPTGRPSAPSDGPLSVFIEGISSGITFPVSIVSSFVQGGAIPTGGSPVEQSVNRRPDSMAKSKGMTMMGSEGFEAPVIKPYEGEGMEVVFKNIKLLRERSVKRLKQAMGVNIKEDLERLPQELKDFVAAISTEGNRNVKGFSEAIENLKIEGKLFGPQVVDSWRAYKDALTGYLINNAERALSEYKMAEETGDMQEIGVAYEDFQNTIERLQDRIKSDVGKASEIFTEQKQWIFPDIAKAAGVYMSPVEIQRKSAKELESDPELQRVFEKITADLSGGGVQKAPISKARDAIKELTQMNPEMVKLMENGRLLERVGPEIAEAWDFEGSVEKLSRLRNALELFKKYKVSDIPLSAEKKNLELVIKMLKDAENRLAGLDVGAATQKGGTGQWGETGAIPVPKWLDPKTQQAMHSRNISKIQEYLKKPTTGGGAKLGEDITYTEKIMDQAGTVIKNQRHLFTKYGEAANSAGEMVGKFSQRHMDLNEAMTRGGGKQMTSAIKRAIMWGSASTVVYGGISKLREAITTLADIETNVASLRMVMRQLDTDFGGMTESAVGFSKDYGVPVNDVLKSMKVFAQQGLDQEEVIDRSRVSTLASNVTTLSSVEATEALTASMKVFEDEGSSAMRFLDSWSEVEAKHAITAGDLADAIKKSASAAKTAGITFDELNGIVASIGAVTRQTGKEVGTSMRFILRRLTTEKGPIELGKLGISTMTGGGELKKGFTILDELAGKWKGLGSAQRLAIAQAIGGTRQYNSLIVMMDNWDKALEATEDSINSKGSAERKNLELMKTYEKQVQQTKAAMVELQMSIGKVAFPIFKVGLKGAKVLAETLTGIPDPIKAASAGLLLFITYLTKGAKITETIADFFRGGMPIFGGIGKAFKEEMKIGAFEAFGIGKEPKRGSETEGLKTITAGKKVGAVLGKSTNDFESALGKSMHLLVSAGREFNSYMVSAAGAAGKTGEFVGKGVQVGGGALSALSGVIGTKLPVASVVGEVAAMGTTAGGVFIEKMSSKLGDAGGAMFKSWAQDNTGIIASIAPMLLTLDMLAPHLKVASDGFMKTTRSSQDFEKSMYQVRRSNETALKSLKSVSSAYKRLQTDIGAVQDLSTVQGEEKVRQQDLGTYRSPLLESADIQERAIKITNKVAKENYGLIAGFDSLGNAVLNSNSNFKTLFATLEKSKLKDMAKTEVAVAAKHIEDLTKTGGSEKWKSELKDLTKEIPVFGSLISDQIKVSPVKAMETTIAKLNSLVTSKAKSPLSTVYDEDIKNLQIALTKLKTQFNATYGDFKRVIAGISVEGLSRQDITKILGSDELRKGYELMLEIEPTLQVAGVKGVADWKDVLGAEVLKRVLPGGTSLDVTKDLTIANLETAGIGKREGKVLSGDLVTFMDDASEKFGMAGDQAIVNLKETTDGVFEWVATYFNKKTLMVEEKAFDADMQAMVESIFPQRKIQEDISDRIDALNTFVAGAGAGLRGISKKDFKREMGLGERFFSDISTSTIIQGTKGFTPETGFGESPFQKGWSEDFNKYYAKPMEDYGMLMESLQKMKLEGISPENIKMTTGLYEKIVQLQNVLKNNQVIMQYRAVFADLTKTMEANTRATEENVMVEKSRLNLTRETSGLLKGKSAGLAQTDLGIRKAGQLNAQQRLLIESPEFEKTAKTLKELETRRAGSAEGVYAADKSLAALESIRDVSKGFGTTLSSEDIKKYTETVAKTGDIGTAELKLETSKVAENTSATVDRLDRLLENFQDQGSVDDLMSSWTDAIGTLGIAKFTKAGRTKEALGRVADVREEALASGDQEGIIRANKALDLLSKSLVEQVGLVKATKMTKGEFGREELAQRAFGGLDFKTLESEMRTFIPEGSKSKKFDTAVAGIYKTQGENVEKSAEKTLLNSKNIAGATAGLATYEAFNTKYLNAKVKEINTRISELESKTVVDEAGKPSGVMVGSGTDKELADLREKLDIEEKRAKFHGTVKAASGAAAGAMVFARSMGLQEKNVKRLGAGAAGLGIYGAAKMQTGLTGEDMPEYFKDYGKDVSKFTKTMTSGGDISKWAATKEFKSKSEEFVKKFTESVVGLEKHTEAIKKDTAATEEAGTKKGGTQESDTAGMFYGGLVKSYANGGVVNGKSGKIKGPGTGTSDSIRMDNVPEGSFIIPSKYAPQAEAYLKSVKGSGSGVDIRVSNGEYYIGPEDAKLLGMGTLESLKTGQIKKFANGGSVGNTRTSTTGGTPTVNIDTASLNKFSQISSAATAATLTMYATEKSTQKVRVSELDALASKESSAIYDLIMANPDAANSVLAELTKQTEEIKKGSVAPTEEVSLVLDADEEFKKTADDVNKLKESLTDTFDATTKDVEKLKSVLSRLELAKQFEMEIEAMEQAVKSARFKDAIFGSLKTGKGIYEGMAQSSPIDLGEYSTLDLSGMQLAQLVDERGKQAESSLMDTLSDMFNPINTFNNYIKSSVTDLATFVGKLDPISLFKNKGILSEDIFGEYQKLESEKGYATSGLETAIGKRTEAASELDFAKKVDSNWFFDSDAVDEAQKELDNWDEVIEDHKKIIEDASDKQSKYAVEISKESAARELTLGTLKSMVSVMSEIGTASIKAKYAISNLGMGGTIRGAVTGLQTPPQTVSDLSSEQYAWKQASSSMREDLERLQATQIAYNNIQERLISIDQQRIALAPDIQLGGKGTFVNENDRQIAINKTALLNTEFKNLSSQAEKLAKTIELAGKIDFVRKGITDIMQSLETGVLNLRQLDIADSLGIDRIKTALSELYGGSSKFAPQFTDINQRQRAGQVGVNLVHGISNSFDTMAADLRRTVLESNDPKQRMEARRQLYNIPYLEQDEEDRLKFLKQSEKLTTRAEPMTNMINSISKLISVMEIQGEDEGLISELRTISDATTAAVESAIEKGEPEKFKDIYETAKKGLEGKLPDKLVEGLLKPQDSQVYTELTKQTTYLDGILQAIQGQDVNVESIRESFGVKSGPALLESNKIGDSIMGQIAKFFYPKGSPKDKLASGGMIKGPGTGTSDDISMDARPGSYVIQSKYADKAAQYLNGVPNGKTGNSNGVPILVSNGEYMMSPEQVAASGGKGAADLLNKGKTPKFADGGFFSEEMARAAGLRDQYEQLKLANIQKEVEEGMSLKGTAKSLLLAGGEWMMALGGGAMSLGSMGESIYDYQKEHGISKTLGSGVDIAGSLSKSVWDTISDKKAFKQWATKAKETIKEDASKGAVGLTTGIFGTLTGGLTSGLGMKAVAGAGKKGVTNLIETGKDKIATAGLKKDYTRLYKDMVDEYIERDVTGSTVRDVTSFAAKSKVVDKDLPSFLKKYKDDPMASSFDSQALFGRIQAIELYRSKELKDISKFVPKGSKYLGHGVEATAFRQPSGKVVRIDPRKLKSEKATGVGPERPEISGVLQAYDTALIKDTYKVETLPYAPSVKDTGKAVPKSVKDKAPKGMSNTAIINADRKILAEKLQKQGYKAADLNNGNVAYDAKGELMAIDPGGIAKKSSAITTPDDFSDLLSGEKLPAMAQRLTGLVKEGIGSKQAISEIFHPGKVYKESILDKVLGRNKKRYVKGITEQQNILKESAEFGMDDMLGLAKTMQLTSFSNGGSVSGGSNPTLSSKYKPKTQMDVYKEQLNWLESQLKVGKSGRTIMEDNLNAHSDLYARKDKAGNVVSYPRGIALTPSGGDKPARWDPSNPEQSQLQIETMRESLVGARKALSLVGKGRTQQDQFHLAMVRDYMGGFGKQGLGMTMLKEASLGGARLLRDKASGNMVKFKNVDEAKTFMQNAGGERSGRYNVDSLMKTGVSKEEYRTFEPLFFTSKEAIYGEGMFQKEREAFFKSLKGDKSQGLARLNKKSLFDEAIEQYINMQNQSKVPGSGTNTQSKSNGGLVELHTGGHVKSTGPYQLEKDEVVLPKRFQQGGGVDALVETMKAPEGTSANITIDTKKFEESVNKLEEVSENLMVEGVDELKNIKIEVDTSALPEAIEALKNVNIEINSTGAVGADNSDELARALDNINSQILQLKDSSSDEIQIINDKVTTGLATIPDLVEKQIGDNATLLRELNDVSTDVSSVKSSIQNLNQAYTNKFVEVDTRLNSAFTHLYTKG